MARISPVRNASTISVTTLPVCAGGRTPHSCVNRSSVAGAYDCDGRPSAEVLALAVRNAGLHSGLVNPIDEALVRDVPPIADGKLAEIPYDFVRKRLSVVVRCDEDYLAGRRYPLDLITHLGPG